MSEASDGANLLTAKRNSTAIAQPSMRSTGDPRAPQRPRGAAQSIGSLKSGRAAYRPEREAQVLSRLQSANPGPLPNEAIVRHFSQAMSACLALEQTLRVAYLGRPGPFRTKPSRSIWRILR